GRDRLDVRARERVHLFATRTNLGEPGAVDLLERHPALHRALRQVGDSPRDDIAATRREPIDALDARHGRVDVQDHAAEWHFTRDHVSAPAPSSESASASAKVSTVTDRTS